MASVSVILPTFGGDDPEELRKAIDSVIAQSRTPDELLIVRDGPVPSENELVLEKYDSEHSFVTVKSFEKNRGRALARQVGVVDCQGELVAMMDADDICMPSRLERQVRYLQEHPDVDVLGGQLIEFDSETGEELGVRSVPLTHEEIRNLAKSRCPLSQSTVMFRREAAIAAGNYRDVRRMEDYDLWARMMMNGSRFENLPYTLTKARAGEEMYERRGGLEYALEEIRLQRDFVEFGFVTRSRAVINILTRVPIRLMPNRLRAFIYEGMFRDNIDDGKCESNGSDSGQSEAAEEA